MTTMDTSNPRNFWYELDGPKAGIKHAVKNLRWIISNRAKVLELHVSKSNGGGAHFQATLNNGRRFYARFESVSIATAFANRTRFFNAERIVFN